jgi:hypothetical protein
MGPGLSKIAHSNRPSQQPEQGAPGPLCSPLDVRPVRQNDIQERAVDSQVAVVVNQAQVSELIHETAHARSRFADHLRERFLADLRDDRLGSTFLAEIRQLQKGRANRFSLELNS